MNFFTTGSVWQLRGRACEGGHMLTVGHTSRVHSKVCGNHCIPSHLCAPQIQLSNQGAPLLTQGHGNHGICSPSVLQPLQPQEGSPRCRGEDMLSLQQHLSPCPSLLQICALVPIQYNPNVACQFPVLCSSMYASEHICGIVLWEEEYILCPF